MSTTAAARTLDARRFEEETETDQASNPFFQQLLAEIPALYARARFLERNATAADDLVQDTLERALRKAHRFTPGTDLRRWLLVILQNLFTDRWRERVRHHSETGDLADLPEPANDADSPPLSERMTLDEVRRALTQVEEPLRTAFELRFFEQLTYRQVAARTGVPVGTVGTRIWRARLRIVDVARSNVDALDFVTAASA